MDSNKSELQDLPLKEDINNDNINKNMRNKEEKISTENTTNNIDKTKKHKKHIIEGIGFGLLLGENTNKTLGNITTKIESKPNGESIRSSLISKPKVVDDNPNDEYDEVNFDNYGVSILKKFGYDPKSDKNIKPLEIKTRVKGVGLGAEILTNKPKEVNNVMEEIKENTFGSKLYIIDGQYKGFKCLFKEHIDSLSEVFLESKKYLVEILPTSQNIYIKGKYLSNIKPNENINNGNNHKTKDTKINENHCVKENNTYTSTKKSEKNEDKNHDSRVKQKLKWIKQNIVVKIIKKEKSDLFLKKGVIIEIVDEHSFSLRLENNNIIENLKEDDLQTVIPKNSNELVLIISGKYKNEEGVFISRDKKKDLVYVKLNNDFSIVSVHPNQCCLKVDDPYSWKP